MRMADPAARPGFQAKIPELQESLFPGQAWVQFVDTASAEEARRQKDRQSMGGRYIEIFSRGHGWTGTWLAQQFLEARDHILAKGFGT